MSFNLELQGGKNYRLPVGGKYCPQDIEIAAIGGQTEGMYCWAKSAQKNELPFGYTKVRNLVSTGTQLIDTYIVPTGDTKIQTTVNYTHTGTGYLFGCLNSWLSGAYGMIHYANAVNSIQYLYGATGGAVAIASNVDNEIEMSGTGIKVNGASVATITKANIGATYSIYLFGRHTSSSAITETMTGTIGDTEIYQDGSTLSKNLLCCLDADGTPCMHDTITGENHYNIGTGTFGTGDVEYKSEILGYVLSDELNAYPQDGYGEDGFYYKRLMDNIPWHDAGSYVWAKSDADGNLIEYVVSDNPSEFPEDGQGDDGYYYKLRDMTEKKIKYASGTASGDRRITVSGLGFKPIAVGIFTDPSGTGITAYGFADETGNSLAGRWGRGYPSGGVSTLTTTNDGFSMTWGGYSGTISVTWHAVGY